MVRENPDEIGSLVKAFALLQIFSPDVPRVTITQAAELAHLTRPTARRILLTCVGQEFMQTDGREFWLTPKVMRLGFGYLSTLPYWDIAQPHLRELADAVNDSCSMATLDGHEVVYILRVPVRRAMITLNVGSRLPAHATSLGKALVAFSDDETISQFLAAAPFEALTPHTITEADSLREELERVRQRGYATSDGERELGVCSAAAPVFSRPGRALAAINVSANSVRVSHTTLVKDYVPHLLHAANKISTELGFTGMI